MEDQEIAPLSAVLFEPTVRRVVFDPMRLTCLLGLSLAVGSRPGHRTRPTRF